MSRCREPVTRVDVSPCGRWLLSWVWRHSRHVFVFTQLYSESSRRVHVETGVPASAAGDTHTNTPAPANTQPGQLQETAAGRQTEEDPAAAGGAPPPRRRN